MKKWLKEYKIRLIVLTTTVVVFLGVSLLVSLLFSIGNDAATTKNDDKQAEELIIDIPDPCDYGTLTVLDRDNDVLYQYSGKIDIKNDGKDGEKIEIIVKHP